MQMKNFILHSHNILQVEVRIKESDCIFGVQWKNPDKPYGDTWILKSYSNKSTGEKDLSNEEIENFMDIINARWNWNMEAYNK